jgi:Flp pilus assembly protein TadG
VFSKSRLSRILARKRRGGTLVETAICGSILMAFTFGVVEVGYYFYCQNIMEGAAREGCRNGILQSVSGVSGNASSVNTTILNYLKRAGLCSSSVTAPASEPATMGNYTITIYDYNYDTNTATSEADPSDVAVGDGLEVKISASWSVIGAFARASSSGGQYVNPSASSGKVLGYCIMRKEAD